MTSPSDEYELINKDPYETAIDGVNYRDSYYRLKGTGDKAPKGKEALSKYKDNVEPIHKPDWMRYAGVFGPAIGLGL